MNVASFAHAWLFAFMLATLLVAVAVVPAFLMGIRLRAGKLFEVLCWVTLGIVVLARQPQSPNPDKASRAGERARLRGRPAPGSAGYVVRAANVAGRATVERRSTAAATDRRPRLASYDERGRH